MAIETAAELVQFLAEELRRQGIKRSDFAEITGLEEERLKQFERGAWHHLTVNEIGAIAEGLNIDFSSIWSSSVRKHRNGMNERPRP